MKDFLERELQMGDYVMFMQQNYRSFGLARVVKFTPQKVRVKWGPSPWQELLQTSNQLVKVEGDEVLIYALKHGGI